MTQSLLCIYVHWVFSTKDRYTYYKTKDERKELHGVLVGKAKNLQCNPIIFGGVADHVHMLTTLATAKTIAECVKEIKHGSNLWVRDSLNIAGF